MERSDIRDGLTRISLRSIRATRLPRVLPLYLCYSVGRRTTSTTQRVPRNTGGMAMTVDYTRRKLLRTAATGGAALAVAANAAPATAQTPARRPNIVFILADDMGYADISCYGRRDLVTANIDRIAAQGTRFTQGYANSPVCTASRVAIITGRYQIRLAVGLEEPISARTDPGIGLPPEHPTLPSLLRKAGYGTTLIGKWHLGALPLFGPHKSGYDHFFGFRSGSLDYYRPTTGVDLPEF